MESLTLFTEEDLKKVERSNKDKEDENRSDKKYINQSDKNNRAKENQRRLSSNKIKIVKKNTTVMKEV